MARQAGAMTESILDGRVCCGVITLEDEVRAKELVYGRCPCYVRVACVVD
jgi:hypothetical protein